MKEQSQAQPLRIPRVIPASPPRLARLGRGVALSEAARAAGLTLSRASIIERHPDLAKPGEIDRLLEGVERAAGSSA
jgi:ribosomal protein L13E